MVISSKYKYIFISVPKTGSQTIRDFFLENDDSACWNSVLINEKKYIAQEHDRARNIKKLLNGYYGNYYVIAFIRNPFERAVSGYFFYRRGKLINVLKGNDKRKIFAFLNRLIAKIIPFYIWVLIKPLRSNREYLTDYDGKLIVDFIGRTEHLEADLEKVINHLKIPIDINRIRSKNLSSYNRKLDYFNNKILYKLFLLKMKKDFDFYKNLISKSSL